MSQTTCPDDCQTLGVDARSLARYRAVETEDSEWIVYDDENEGAWIQSDVYFPRASCL